MAKETRPLIGITTDHNPSQRQHLSPHAYAQAVAKAGGLPVLLPYAVGPELARPLLDRLDGVVLTGGNDIHPDAWGEAYHPKAKPVDHRREAFERALLDEIHRRKTPTLGICMGFQLLNVYRGGSLQQHIPDLKLTPTIRHWRVEGRCGEHAVRVEPNTLLSQIASSEQIDVNSSHHQAVGKLGQDLRVTAVSPDRIIEAIEDPSFPMLLAVQWHPERITDRAPQLRLFEKLVHVAGDTSR